MDETGIVTDMTEIHSPVMPVHSCVISHPSEIPVYIVVSCCGKCHYNQDPE
jgi:hypothetical protein